MGVFSAEGDTACGFSNTWDVRGARSTGVVLKRGGR